MKSKSIKNAKESKVHKSAKYGKFRKKESTVKNIAGKADGRIDITLNNIKYKAITKYYDVMENDRIKCLLCPNECIIIPGMQGLCHARKNIGGKFYSTAYGYPCSINVDPVEKKPLYHFYPGEKILSLGTFGCNLSCKGCQNFEIARIDAKTQETIIEKTRYHSPEEIVDIALKSGIRLIAYTYNEPTIFFEYMMDIARLARKKGIKNVIVSNGYINPKPLKELCKYIDAANIDIKGINDGFYMNYSHAHVNPVMETIKMLYKNNIWLELTNLIIHGLNDDSKELKELCAWITTNIGNETPLHFSRFYPYYKASDIPPTSKQKLMEAKDIAQKSGMKYVYIGNLGFLDNTFCSKCNEKLIERDYDSINIHGLIGQKKNKCNKCNAILPGIFT